MMRCEWCYRRIPHGTHVKAACPKCGVPMAVCSVCERLKEFECGGCGGRGAKDDTSR